MVSIRTTRVNNKEYLQVVEYYSVNGVQHTKVLKSFGDNTLFNRLQALQFKAAYQALKTFKQDASVQGAEDLSMIINLALATFGAVLGVKFILEFFNKDE